MHYHSKDCHRDFISNDYFYHSFVLHSDAALINRTEITFCIDNLSTFTLELPDDNLLGIHLWEQ